VTASGSSIRRRITSPIKEDSSMKVVAVNGSARKDGNTARLVEEMFEPLREAGHECLHLQLAAQRVQGCTACRKCYEKKDRRCHGRKDYGNEVIEALSDADAIVFLGVGGGKGDVENDAEGLATMTRLGENMAWLLGRLGE